MLSSGTRIGPTRILSWLGEGSTGQSYRCEATEGEDRGSLLYVKLIPREISEKNGFEDFFQQECQTLEQLEGTGIWPIRSFGIMKWKHWVAYEWLEGESVSCSPVNPDGEAESSQVRSVRSLADLMELAPEKLTPPLLLAFMIDLHRGIYRIHQSGIAHGNLKPSNVLVRLNEAGGGEAWVTELGFWRLVKFRSIGMEEPSSPEVSHLNQDGLISLEEGARYRPTGVSERDMPEGSWDISAFGNLVQWAIGLADQNSQNWTEWKAWAKRASDNGQPDAFPSVAHSMQALPGIGDISQYGVKMEEVSEELKLDLEALKAKREREWALSEKQGNLRFRRNMTGLASLLFLAMHLFSSVYLFFQPAPWTEYSLEDNADSYQLGAGLWSGDAWGIVPSAYDENGEGGQDVVGKWEREDGLFKLSFRRFKKINDKESGKKLWQFIGTGSTTPDDYVVWHDYLLYDRSREALILVKRVNEDDVFIPGREGTRPVMLYPEQRIKKSGRKIESAEIAFFREDEGGVSWTLFFGLGFLLACSIYWREVIKLNAEQVKSVE